MFQIIVKKGTNLSLLKKTSCPELAYRSPSGLGAGPVLLTTWILANMRPMVSIQGPMQAISKKKFLIKKFFLKRKIPL